MSKSGSGGRVPILAHRDGISLVLTLLFGMGSMCPKCGFGTRATSKRWAKCKKCGERVARQSADEITAKIKANRATHPEQPKEQTP